MAAIAGSAGRLAGIPGVGAFVSLASQISELRGWIFHLRSNLKRDTSALHTTADEFKAYIKSVGIDRWARYWHYGRQLISLQVRLFCEQVYSDLGGEWAELVTGFGPLKRARVSIRGAPAERGQRGISGRFAARLDARNK